nr:MAG TPA: hypothetical protein [Caudoviricetes sp.]
MCSSSKLSVISNPSSCLSVINFPPKIFVF